MSYMQSLENGKNVQRKIFQKFYKTLVLFLQSAHKILVI